VFTLQINLRTNLLFKILIIYKKIKVIIFCLINDQVGHKTRFDQYIFVIIYIRSDGQCLFIWVALSYELMQIEDDFK